jgi:hypothetical protein
MNNFCIVIWQSESRFLCCSKDIFVKFDRLYTVFTIKCGVIESLPSGIGLALL